jgi:hypothetical protein
MDELPDQVPLHQVAAQPPQLAQLPRPLDALGDRARFQAFGDGGGVSPCSSSTANSSPPSRASVSTARRPPCRHPIHALEDGLAWRAGKDRPTRAHSTSRRTRLGRVRRARTVPEQLSVFLPGGSAEWRDLRSLQRVPGSRPMSSAPRPGQPLMDDEPVTFRERRLGPAFDRRVVTIAPGRARLYDPDEWHDSLVVVEQGEIHVECRAGRFRSFRDGAVLWLTGLPLRALHNRGSEPAVVVAVSRTAPGAG